MTTKTTADLVVTVAEYLRISATDIPLSAENNDKLTRAINRISGELRELGKIWWPDNAIPAACEEAMKFIVCARQCGAHGKAGQGYEAGEQKGLEMLIDLRHSASLDGPLKVEYF